MAINKTTICIIGAGPSGIVTSLFLAKAGVACTLIDKESFPRSKPCADNVTGNSIRVLDEIDPEFVQTLHLEKTAWDMKGIVAHTPNGAKMKIDFLPLYEGTYDPSCYAISRYDFDKALMQRAKAEPLITVIENYNVRDLERGENGILISEKTNTQPKIFANLVVVCSGSNANFMKKLHASDKADKDFAVGVRAYFRNVKPAPNRQYCELFITKDLLPGGLYLTEMPNGNVNANVVVRSDVVKRKHLNLNKILEQTLQTHPVLRERFADAELIGKGEGSGLLLGTKKRKISGDNFILAGDAAGLIDLLSANGIPQAMLSGKIAAEFAARCAKNADFSAKALAEYDERVFDRVKNYLKLSKFVAPFLSYSLVLKIILWAMNFVAKKYDSNDEVRDLIYDANPVKRLLRPKFYYKIFFGIKNADALG